MDAQTQLELEAAAFRRLQKHLMEERTDVQNTDMMNLAGFCRNCTSRWYQEAANERGIEMTKGLGLIRDKIFEPGVSTKSGGWGVGLALSRRIVEGVHKGKIELLETVEGTTFQIRLPAAEA